MDLTALECNTIFSALQGLYFADKPCDADMGIDVSACMDLFPGNEAVNPGYIQQKRVCFLPAAPETF